MKHFDFYLQKILLFLRVRTIIGGLDVGDQAIRLVWFDGKTWQLYTVKLEPGVFEGGEIKDRERFVNTLLALKENSKIGAEHKNKKINIVLALSSANIYSQVFSLPDLTGDDLTKAAELNLQMSSPGEVARMHAGWEIVGKNESTGNIEVLSSYVDKTIVDPMVQVLFEAGFFTVAVESRSLALTRVLRERGSGIDVKKPYLLIRIDDVGLDFLVIRNGEPYFEYGSRWSEIAEPNGEVAIPRFEAELAGHLRQVLNFYSKHWVEPVAAVIVSANALQEEIEGVIKEASGLPMVNLTLEIGQAVSSEWLVGLGASLRGITRDIGHEEVNLLGDEWKERFHEQQILTFIRFWQVLTPISLALLVGSFIVALGFLNDMQTSLASGSIIGSGVSASSTTAALQASSTAFNNEVAMIRQIEQSIPSSTVLDAVVPIAATNGVTLSRVADGGKAAPISLNGTASSEDRILAFKQAISGDGRFSSVNLPLSNIQSNGGVYAFSMTFVFTP